MLLGRLFAFKRCEDGEVHVERGWPSFFEVIGQAT
jgi:hypothetical protein